MLSRINRKREAQQNETDRRFALPYQDIHREVEVPMPMTGFWHHGLVPLLHS